MLNNASRAQAHADHRHANACPWHPVPGLKQADVMDVIDSCHVGAVAVERGSWQRTGVHPRLWLQPPKGQHEQAMKEM